LKPIKVIINNPHETEIILGYLIDHENAIVFAENDVWLCRVTLVGNELYDIIRIAMLGEAKESNTLDYAKRIVKHLQRMSIFDFIVQKFFYSDDDINFDVTNI
jgi:hypothetical protein